MGRMQQHIPKLYDFWWQLGSNHTIRFCTKAGTNYRGRINFWRTGKHSWSCAWPTSKYHSKKNHQDLFQNQNSKNSAMMCTIHPQLNPNKSPFFLVLPWLSHTKNIAPCLGCHTQQVDHGDLPSVELTSLAVVILWESDGLTVMAIYQL